MAPKKKSKLSSSSVKKSHSHQQQARAQAQPSKFGIQHFFHRHTQNVLSASQTPSSHPKTLAPCNAATSTTPRLQNPRILIPPKMPQVQSQDATLSMNTNHNPTSGMDVYPQISMSLPLQRVQFSPGLLIKQSQDDAADEVTWKISPVNERLHTVSKNMPEVIKALVNSSNLNCSTIRPCSLNKASPTTASPLSSPTPKVTETSMVHANRIRLKRVNPFHDMPTNGSLTLINSSLASLQSPFRTPPSLSYCHDKHANVVDCNGKTDQLGLKQHKKALIELLDQVEDAISVEDSFSNDINVYSSKTQDKNNNETHPPVGATMDSQEKVTDSYPNNNFLVLEVTEKHGAPDSSAAQCPYKVLRLLDEQSGEERAVNLWEEWFYSVIAPGDTVNVIGEFDDNGTCDVDHDNNLLIVHPDILVSGTRVASSFSCPRRTVLDERLKCSEHSTTALIGILLHQIFQAGLRKKNPTISFLEEYARIVLQKNIESLYACGVNENVLLKTLVEAIPKVLNWIISFKDSQDSKAPMVNFGSDDGSKMLRISEVIDIEEMAWAPKYGLKGMIDASVRVKIESTRNEADERILPLEFKTGKVPSGQSSMEHCAQVILYTLLMSERYLKHIDYGLLYYLQSNQTQGIMVQRSDVVGLIMRRNELASDILKASTMQQLPPMLRSPSICRSCRHLDACTIYHKVHGGTTESSGLGSLFDSHIHHLTPAHCAFLQHWDRMIDLEAKETQLGKNQIWHSHGLTGDEPTGCLSAVVLDSSDEFLLQKPVKEDRYIYRFVHKKIPSNHVHACDRNSLTSSSFSTNNLNCTLKSGDHVILSTEIGHQPIASGIITDISCSHISVSFSKRLRLPGGNSSSEANDLLQEVWRIDKDEFTSSFSVMRFNLIQLFLQREQSSHFRKIIVDLEAPRFDSGCIFSQDPAIAYIWSVKSLNGDQRRAILKILTAKDYTLILGMPGTGKTSTMVHAVKALLIRGASILLTSYTNSAVDNLLIKLKAQGIDFLRIGRRDAVHEEVQANCTSAMDICSVEDISLRLDQVNVVAVTCLGINSPLLANKKFDVCIMDEAGQITLPISLGPLMLASMFVLVGDHYQLPPIVQSAEARERGMGVSLFCRLSEAHPQAISALQSQYRMSQGIMELSNALIYGDRLRCGSSEIANSKLEFSTLKSCSSWLKEVLNPSRPVILINTDKLPALEVKDSKSVNNPIEVHIIAEVIKELLSRGIQGKEIGIITPYNSQANLIQAAFHVTSVEIHTIDKYQGRDKDCILVSFVRSSENQRNWNSSLLGDWHRINVAITRAKKKLIMVGSCKTLSKVPLLKLLIEKVDNQWGILNVSKEDIKL